MNELLYVGKFLPWKDSNEDELFEALKIFDNVLICVMVSGKKIKKGQPSKLLDKTMKNRVKIVQFKKLKNLLHVYKTNRYIMFARN